MKFNFSNFIPLPKYSKKLLSNLQSRLFFEYQNYTPFLGLKNQPKICSTLKIRAYKQAKTFLKTIILGQTYQNLDITKLKSFNNNNLFTLSIQKTPIYLIYNLNYDLIKSFLNIYSFLLFFIKIFFNLLFLFKKTIGDGMFYLKGLFIVFFIDACLTDDEPL